MTTKPSKKMTPQKQPGFPIWLPLIIVAGVALIAVAVLNNNGSSSTAVPGASTTNEQPVLAVNIEKIDLGDVKLGQTVSASFEVSNTGTAPLRFKEKPFIQVAAGC